MFLTHRRGLLRATAVFITVLAASAVLTAQQTFQFFISVADATGKPVTDITETDVVEGTWNAVPFQTGTRSFHSALHRSPGTRRIKCDCFPVESVFRFGAGIPD